MKRFRLLIILLLSIFVLSSCTTQDQNKPDASSVVNKYYLSVMSGDYGTAYECLSEESKLKYPFDKFKENHEFQKKGFGPAEYEILGFDDTKYPIVFNIKATPPKVESLTTEPAFVIIENEEYKIYIGDEFNKITSIACNKIAFENLYSHEKDFDYIIYVSKKAIELDPKNDLAYADLARAYTFAGNISAAIDAIDKYIYLYPSFPKNDSVLSEMYSLKGVNLLGQHKTHEAKKAYQTALQLDPTNSSAFDTLQSLK